MATAPLNLYAGFVAASAVAMNDSVISPAGSGQAHQNLQPSLVLLFCIAVRHLPVTQLGASHGNSVHR